VDIFSAAPGALEPASLSASPAPRAPRRWRIAPPVVVAAAVAVLALVETAVALIAPLRAPTDADWAAAEREVRAGFRAGDLIVAAPAWADPILRVHLGDLLPAKVAGRMDDARFGRVWEVSQRDARAPEARRGHVALERRAGALTVRRIERDPAQVTYDFADRWTDARMTRTTLGRPDVSCPRSGDRLQCPDVGFNYLHHQIVEVDTRLRDALLCQPVGGATVVIEYPAVPLGRELVVATGLHNVWMRKAARGVVHLRLLVAGTPQAAITTDDDSGWQLTRIDSSAYDGKVVPVRFEITSPAPYARHFAFAAEARR
jgi:hypothetical protein